MRPFNAFLFASLALVFLVVSDTRATAQVPQMQVKQEVVVTTPASHVRGTLGDHVIRFDGAVQVPGVSLGPGTYIFRQPIAGNPNILQVLSADRHHAYATFFTVPTYRAVLTDFDLVTLGEPVVEGAPRWIARIDVTGSRTGYEPLYPKKAGMAAVRTAD
jgi:hypothetical protein